MSLRVFRIWSLRGGVDRRSGQPKDPGGLPRSPEVPEGCTRQPESPKDPERLRRTTRFTPIYVLNTY